MAAKPIPPIPQDKIGENLQWREWFRNLGTYIQGVQLGDIILGIAQGGTGASTAPQSRVNLGLGSMATQSSTSVNITGGSLSGVTIPAGDVIGLGTMAVENSNSVTITGGAISGATLSASNGATGTFRSSDTTPKTITVTNGIITSIV